MTIGTNLLGNLIEFSYPEDDSVGGAQPSGTVVYEGFRCRLQTLKPTEALLEQGYESVGYFTVHIIPYTVPVKHNNEIEITAPVISPHYGDRFRIVGEPQRTSMSPYDNRNYLIVNVKRIEKSRTVQ